MGGRDADKRNEAMTEKVALNDDEPDHLPLQLSEKACPLGNPLCQLMTADRMILSVGIAMHQLFEVALNRHSFMKNRTPHGA